MIDLIRPLTISRPLLAIVCGILTPHLFVVAEDGTRFQVRQLIEYRNAKPLVAEREWVLRNRTPPLAREIRQRIDDSVAGDGLPAAWLSQPIQVDPDATIMAASGTVLLHRQGGKYVISRRPPQVAHSIEKTITAVAGDLIDALDIEQIEAVSDYLRHPKFRDAGAYCGAIADRFYREVCRAVFNFKPHLEGDGLERSKHVAQYLLAKYPGSQVARCTLANWHNSIEWEARGGGYAGSVTDEGWKVFHEHIQLGQSVLEPRLSSDKPISQLYHLALSFAKSTNKTLQELGELARRIRDGEHAENGSLHHQVAVYLMPRWHGSPGMVESYLAKVADTIGGSEGDAVYANSIALMRGLAGRQGDATLDFQWDLDRLVAGTEAYYRQRRDPDVIDHSIYLLVHHERISDLVELVRMCEQRMLLVPSIATIDTAELPRAKSAPRKPLEVVVPLGV